MSKSQTVQSMSLIDWQMPLSLEQYDRSPTLTRTERFALARVTAPRKDRRQYFRVNHLSTRGLVRLLQPLQDVYALKEWESVHGRGPYLRSMCQQMLQMNKSFWAWSKEEWFKAISDSSTQNGIRQTMRTAAYLLCGLLILDDRCFPSQLARAVFGTKMVTEEYEKLADIIFGINGFGYVRSTAQEMHLRATLSFIMLVNRNPHIEAFTVECLQATKQLLLYNAYQRALRWIAQALVHLKILRDTALADVFGSNAVLPVWWEYTGSDVDPTWLAWVQAYSTQTNKGEERYRKEGFHQMLIVGRWLKKYHPEIVSPTQWTESLGYEYVTWVCHAKGYELASQWSLTRQNPSKAHQPLHAKWIHSRLGAVRRFFKALQRRPYLIDKLGPQRLILDWDPDETFATPAHIRKQIGPNPRTLDPAWWQKLTWAAATLSTQDLAAGWYPSAFYRAVALVWVTGARRADEIRRLKVGCVSREWAPEMRNEDGNQVEPEEDLAFLRIPVNKMRGEYWIPIPSYTADAIEVWERLRPKLQDPQIDRKEHKPTEYLFMVRNQLMGKEFLNRSIIPLLCKVAGLVDENGVPLRDAVGRITSHRARSTLATWLRGNGLSLVYIAKLLGHTDLKSLPWYLREDKYGFAREVRKHNPLHRVVTAILDTEALKRGAGEPAVFYYLGYGDDGRPHMCASPDYSTCSHQMHCRKCEMYVDAQQAEIIERRPGVLTIEVHIPTPLLAEEVLDQEGLEEEITQHLPAPEVPDPAYHLNKNVPPRSGDPELQQMKQELESLTAEWVEKVGKFDLRSIGMKSLKRRLADLARKIEARERQSNPSNGFDPT